MLFADPTQLAPFFDAQARAIAALTDIAKGVGSPEFIDDGQQTAPSKRIIAQLPGYASAKVSVGPQVAERIGLERLRATCPHFAEWLTRLERLGASGGP